MRRRGMEPGSKADDVAVPHDTEFVHLTDGEWRVLTALKREFDVGELERAAGRAAENFWAERALEAGVSMGDFLAVGASLHARGVIGRFSTFLEHVETQCHRANCCVTQYNALFHWAIPPRREMETGQQVGRFHIMTHCYWREGGAEFNHVNIMGVMHGTDKARLVSGAQGRRRLTSTLRASGFR